LQSFKLAELTDYYKNPRSLSEKEFKQLKTSLDKFGMIDKPIVNLDASNTIIGGHQRKHVLEASGVKECECWVPDRELSDKEVEELNIRLNKNTGSWDFDVLANEFELDDLLDWGFDKGELDLDLWADDAPEDVEPQIDKAEELRVKWGVESGQLWQLGEHRLICGDCTDKAVVERVMGGEVAILMVTDPPYGVEYDSAWRAPYSSGEYSIGKIENDDRADWSEVYPLFGANVLYVWHGGLHADVVAIGLKSVGYELRAQIIWNKGVMVFGRGHYHWKHEPCWYAVKKGEQAHWIGDHSQHTIWDCENNSGASRTKDSADDFHANHISQKPVKLMERAINNHEAEYVADPFLGSGTTLIACERLGRKCRAVEISPAYVAVAIQRWVDVTGGVPVLLSN